MNHSFILLIVFITVCCTSCENIQNSIMSIGKKDVKSFVNKDIDGIFNKEKCWWAYDSQASDTFPKNGKTFKRCVIEVTETQFPTKQNQLYLPDDTLINKLEEECNDTKEFVLTDYFWSKEKKSLGKSYISATDIGKEQEEYYLYGLFLRKYKEQ